MGEADRSAFALSGWRIAALTRQAVLGLRLARPRDSGRQDSAWLEVTAKTLTAKDVLAWLGGRDSSPLAASSASRGVNWNTGRAATSEELSSEAAGRQGFEPR